MEIIFKDDTNNLFGSTKALGIGKRKPNLIYGKKLRELRENAGYTIEQLANKFKMKTFDLERLEDQKQTLTDKIYEKYKKEFNVEKEYFFDLDLETLILSVEGYTLKSFETGEECKKVFSNIMKKYFKAVKEGKSYIEIDFSDLSKYE